MLILESLPERQEETGTHPGSTDTGDSCFGEFMLPRGHWCWQVSLWSLYCSLLVPEAHPPTSCLVLVLGTPRQSSQLHGEPTPHANGLAPVHDFPNTPYPDKPPCDMAPPTSRLASAPGTPRLSASCNGTWPILIKLRRQWW